MDALTTCQEAEFWGYVRGIWSTEYLSSTLFQGVKCSSEYIKRGTAKSRQGVTLQSKGCERSNNHHPKQRGFYEDLHSDSYFGVPFDSIRVTDRNVWYGSVKNVRKNLWNRVQKSGFSRAWIGSGSGRILYKLKQIFDFHNGWGIFRLKGRPSRSAGTSVHAVA